LMNTTTHIIVSSRVNENKKSCKYTLAEYLGYTLDDLSHVWVVNDTWATESIRCKTKLDETLHLCHEDLIPVPSVDNKSSGGGTSSSSSSSSSSSMVVANSHQDETHHTNKRAATAETVADHHLSSLLDGVRTTVLIGLDEDDEQLNATRQTLSDPLLRPSTRYLNTTISVKNNGAASSSSSSSSPSSAAASAGWMVRLKANMQGQSITRGQWTTVAYQWNDQTYCLHGSKSSFESFESSLKRSRRGTSSGTMKTPYITYIFSRNRSNDAGLVWSAEHVFGESLGRVNYGPNTPTVVVVVTPEELGQYRGVLSAETRYKGVGCGLCLMRS
jgi:hypothetical protein